MGEGAGEFAVRVDLREECLCLFLNGLHAKAIVPIGADRRAWKVAGAMARR